VISDLPLVAAVLLFATAALVILGAGMRLTAIADQLAVRTGMGGALFGGVFLGGTTSLPGIVTTITAAADGHAELAIANALGGITAQTAFLGLADFAYRRANLEHAAASAANLTQGVMLGVLLVTPLAAVAMPEATLFGIHPASVGLPVIYVLGLRLISQAELRPMWRPEMTTETQRARIAPEQREGTPLSRLWFLLLLLAVVVGTAGFGLTRAAEALMARTGLSESAMGGIFTAVSTSLPELVTVMAAVRRGALALAVGDILGGNCFDILMLAMADVAYEGAAIYTAWSNQHTFLVAVTLFMTNILLLGLLRRERHGVANIGFESAIILVVYALSAIFLLTA